MKQEAGQHKPIAPVTWKQLVATALADLGGEATLKQITERVGENPQCPRTATWNATIRRVVRQYKMFEPFKTPSGQAAYRLISLETVEPKKLRSIEDPHGEQQGLLLQIGGMLGYETYTNPTDKTIRHAQGVSIAQFATVRNDEPSLHGLPLERIRHTDVLWLCEDADGLYLRYAFEVEHSTKVKPGLLRLLRIPARYQTSLYIIGEGDEQQILFDRYMKDSPFREHSERLRFRRYEQVRSLCVCAKGLEEQRQEFGVEFCKR